MLLALLVFVLPGVCQPGRSASEKTVEFVVAVDEKWVRYESPNFELFSHVGESDSRKLLQDLELLRAVFLDRLRFVERARLEVSVYAFASQREFRAYSGSGKKSSAGLYLKSPDRAVILLAPLGDSGEARRVIFHEYVHHLFRTAEADPPVWFNEGMAELFAGVRIEGGQVQVGHPVADRVRILQTDPLLSLDTLFTVGPNSEIYRSDEHAGMFYAESWALLHYLYFGDSGLPPEAVSKFLAVAGDRAASSGVPLRSHFTACFGFDFPEMLKRLERYVRGGSYRFGKVPLPQLEPAESYASARLSRHEARLRLSELALRTHDSSPAKFTLEQAAGQAVPDVRALEALGGFALEAGRRDEAEVYWEKAIGAGSQNPALLRELALAECRRWFTEFDFGLQLPPPAAARMRERLKRSIEREPDQRTAYEMLAYVEAFSEDRSVPNINLVQRHFAKSQLTARALVALAMVRVRVGKKEEALQILKQMRLLNPDPWSTMAGEAITARLEGRAAQVAEGLRTRIEQESNLGPIWNRIRIPSVGVPEDL